MLIYSEFRTEAQLKIKGKEEESETKQKSHKQLRESKEQDKYPPKNILLTS